MSNKSYIEKLEEENQKLHAENRKLVNENSKLSFTLKLNEQTLQHFREILRRSGTYENNAMVEATLDKNKIILAQAFSPMGDLLC